MSTSTLVSTLRQGSVLMLHCSPEYCRGDSSAQYPMVTLWHSPTLNPEKAPDTFTTMAPCFHPRCKKYTALYARAKVSEYICTVCQSRGQWVYTHCTPEQRSVSTSALCARVEVSEYIYIVHQSRGQRIHPYCVARAGVSLYICTVHQSRGQWVHLYCLPEQRPVCITHCTPEQRSVNTPVLYTRAEVSEYICTVC